MEGVFKSIYREFIEPNSKDKDKARREFILNILLSGFFVLSLFAFIVNTYYFTSWKGNYNGANPIISASVLFVIVLVHALSRNGKVLMSGVIFNLILVGAMTDIISKSGVYNPQSLLIASLAIVTSGILVGTRFALFVTFLIISIIFIFTSVQMDETYLMKADWRKNTLTQGDTIIYAVSLSIIALVSWLFNREIYKSLQRARRSEAALRRQRDTLEVLVEKRTNQLKKEQEKLLLEEHRFANFGRHTVGLLHDLANPLTLVSLNLEHLGKNVTKQDIADLKNAVERARKGAKTMERYVFAARKQMQDDKDKKAFYPHTEVINVLEILSSKANNAGVEIVMKESEKLSLTGNSSLFNQMIMNLISNAIDSYVSSKEKKKQVVISIKKLVGKCEIKISDFGSGIPKMYLKKIFEPLFTTKGPEKGTGLGLSLCKEIVESDFNGKISVKSIEGIGSEFRVIIPL